MERLATADAKGRLTFSVAEAASVTGLGRTMIYGLMKDGHLPSIKLKGRRLIRASDLRNLIGEN
ncbi:helix-turn-helix domain-containing protein [Qipengyuania pacifica]|uniref:helix-turn-helix domain-containing protein n=1 Tax=Qipengyuania pacifica TaxID=2860199 RepID=UPI001C9DFD2E|nr:helix-turn-helix domain-containing protein [Qipengyuania pacifica]MBY8332390.1 helix-turn-helix domain-containing protein [Qipengyuania pacifica]